MTRNQTIHTILEHMARTFRFMTKSMVTPFGKHTLSRSETDVLFFVANSKNGLSASELSSLLKVTNGAITQTIDGLISKELVIKHENSNDRRAILITLTDTAQKEFNLFKKNYFKQISPIFSSFTSEEIKTLELLLNKLQID